MRQSPPHASAGILAYTQNVPAHDIIVVGASAGGVEALKRLVSLLPNDLSAAVFVTLHILPRAPSYLPQILNRAGPLSAIHPADGATIQSGRIYVAPPDRHLVIEGGHVHLSSGPKENRHRPAINPLFRSAALSYGPRVVGVVLTGNLDDGTVGLWEIKRRGGVTVVQDPGEALHPEMPQNALASVKIDYQVKLEELPDLLATLARQTAGVPGDIISGKEMQEKLTRWTCPECRGPLDEYDAGPLREYRCRVGHIYGPASLVNAHSETLEATLWAAVVALEEGAEIAHQLQQHMPAETEQLRREQELKQEIAGRIRASITELTDMAAAQSWT